jgi:hypothetical protein
MVVGAVGELRVAESQVPPSKAIATGPAGTLLITLTVCGGVAALAPAVAVKFSVLGVRISEIISGLTVSVTGMVSGLLEAPLDVIVILPW